MESKYFEELESAPVVAGKGGSALRSMANSHRRLTVLRAKVLVAGDPAVGKTSLLQMFQSGGQAYPKSYLMTCGVDFAVKEQDVSNKDDRKVELFLYDVGGQSVFNQRELGSQHFQNSSVAVVVYDVGSRASFLACSKWLTIIRSESAGKPVPTILVANKTDLVERGRVQVRKEEGEEFAQKNSLTFMETSALRNSGVHELFQFIADAYSTKYDDSIRRAQEAC